MDALTFHNKSRARSMEAYLSSAHSFGYNHHPTRTVTVSSDAPSKAIHVQSTEKIQCQLLQWLSNHHFYDSNTFNSNWFTKPAKLLVLSGKNFDIKALAIETLFFASIATPLNVLKKGGLCDLTLIQTEELLGNRFLPVDVSNFEECSSIRMGKQLKVIGNRLSGIESTCDKLFIETMQAHTLEQLHALSSKLWVSQSGKCKVSYAEDSSVDIALIWLIALSSLLKRGGENRRFSNALINEINRVADIRETATEKEDSFLEARLFAMEILSQQLIQGNYPERQESIFRKLQDLFIAERDRRALLKMHAINKRLNLFLKESEANLSLSAFAPERKVSSSIAKFYQQPCENNLGDTND